MNIINSNPRILKRDQLKMLDSAAPLEGAAPAPCASPVVRVVRSGDVVKAIRVDCICGRSLEIECLFDDAPASEPARASKE
ncbi:MAG: hypothetical protein HY286_19305 [Planctomycetes bacterium]|nr:hypothetical protein [Planctomycetota bacterium]